MNKFAIVVSWRASRVTISEGLAVLLSDLIGGLQRIGVTPDLYTTSRHEEGIRKVLTANGIASSAYRLQALTHGSKTLDRHYTAHDPRPRRSWLRSLIRMRALTRGRDAVINFFAWALDTSPATVVPKALAVLGVMAVALLVLAVLLPLIGLAFLAGVAVVLARRARGWLRARLPRVLPHRLLRIALRVKAARQSLASGRVRAQIMERLYARECARLAARLAALKDGDTFFFASAFDSHTVRELERRGRKSVVVFPDAVTAVFPTRYPCPPDLALLVRAVADSVRYADGIVCYSEYARDVQLRRLMDETTIRSGRVEVIPQGFFVEEGLSDERIDLDLYVKNYFPQYGRLQPVQFGSVQYILYPTVDRPHKNAVTLCRAFEKLLRERFLNVKLVLTSPGPSGDLGRFIAERKLHRDVVFTPSVPIDVLNRLIQGAAVVVHPSLAEGGDIFNFSRAVSNGRPALLADIPVARAMFERHGIGADEYREWLFDPFDPVALADRIEQVLDDRSDLLSRQRNALARLSHYQFSDMARRYFEFYRRVADAPPRVTRESIH